MCITGQQASPVTSPSVADNPLAVLLTNVVLGIICVASIPKYQKLIVHRVVVEARSAPVARCFWRLEPTLLDAGAFRSSI